MADSLTPEVTIVPANEASWEDLQLVFGRRGDSSRCQCQRYKIRRDRLGRDLLRHSHGLPPTRDQSRARTRSRRLRAATRRPRALEGYPMTTQPGREMMPGELHVGSRSIFADAGFAEISHPTLRRVVMRVDFSL